MEPDCESPTTISPVNVDYEKVVPQNDISNGDYSNSSKEFDSNSNCSSFDNEIQDSIITEDIIKEENNLIKMNEAKDQEIFKDQSIDNENISKEVAFNRLQHLLKKSQFYSEFLIKKINDRKENFHKKEQKLLAEKEKQMNGESGGGAAGPLKEINYIPKRGQKRKLPSDECLIDDKDEIEIAEADNSMGKQVDHPEGQPQLLTGGIMRDYQLEGFKWMRVLYENGMNGILADEMGLGKTIQTIALIADLIAMKIKGPFFICGPLSTLSNWVNEFKRFTPKIPVLLYHGNRDVRTELRHQIKPRNSKGKPTIVITSYQIAMIDRKYLQHYQWRYLIIDEGHRIKNFQCQLVRELKLYKSDNRLLLTGTPLQNNLSELWSLLNFLLPEVFNDLNVFESWFDVIAMEKSSADAEIIAMENEKQIIATLHKILSPFLLRRTKAEVNIDLPPKKEVYVYAQLAPLQQRYYKATLDRTIGLMLDDKNPQEAAAESMENLDGPRPKRTSRRDIDYSVFDSDSIEEAADIVEVMKEQEKYALAEKEMKALNFPTSKRNLSLRNIMMLLRKICNHPYLVDYPLKDGEYLVNDDIINHSGKLQVLDVLLKALKARNHKVLIFSQMVQLLNILQDYLVYCDYNFGRLDGTMTLDDREQQIKMFNENEECFIFLVSTRAGGLGINLTAADTVIIYDSDWNPQSDLQAQDRCHRYGQTKPVVVYRLITANTIDEKIVIRANAKRKLEKMIIKKGRFGGDVIANQNFQQLNLEDLQELLDIADNKRFDPTAEDLYTPEQLEILMDRSDLVQGSSDQVIQTSEVQGLFKVVGKI